MRIYLDMCSIQRPMDDYSQPRVLREAEAVLEILARCEQGEVDLLDSDALRFEMERNPHPVRRGFVEEALTGAAEFVSVTGLIEQRARGYIQGGMKPLDALHLASAVEGGAAYFCTCDDKLLRRARKADTGATRPVSPLELSEEIVP
ncbi:MAG: nucleic acid-binding protein [Longimicrobiaceae bacterium]